MLDPAALAASFLDGLGQDSTGVVAIDGEPRDRPYRSGGNDGARGGPTNLCDRSWAKCDSPGALGRTLVNLGGIL
jgi:hypothetical protein